MSGSSKTSSDFDAHRGNDGAKLLELLYHRDRYRSPVAQDLRELHHRRDLLPVAQELRELHYRRDLLPVAQELRELHYRRDRYHRRDLLPVAQELQDSPVAQDSMVAVVVSKNHRVVLYPPRAAP
jgi:hypothetical protein